MQKNAVLLSFLPGFAPILLYIAVDSFFGETAGLAAGIALGLGEFLFILARYRRIDAFTLVDTALLVVMGALSWALSDPVFFRLKPAVSGGILALMMIAGAVGPHRLFLPYMQDKLGMGELPETVARRMLTMIAGFGFLTLAHSALTAAAALWWSKGAWDFIAGALFWILALAYMAAWTVPVLVARGKIASGVHRGKVFEAGFAEGVGATVEGAGEILPIVDAEGRVIGKAPRPLCHSGGATSSGAPSSGGHSSGAKFLHPVVRLWLTDGSGGFWLQKRSRSKLVQPGMWDCAVGGHLSFGETAEAALHREAREEIGLTDPGAIRLLGKFVWETYLERELVFVFTAMLPPSVTFKPDLSEVDEVRFWTAREIADALAMAKDTATPCPLTALALHELRSVSGLSGNRQA